MYLLAAGLIGLLQAGTCWPLLPAGLQCPPAHQGHAAVAWHPGSSPGHAHRPPLQEVAVCGSQGHSLTRLPALCAPVALSAPACVQAAAASPWAAADTLLLPAATRTTAQPMWAAPNLHQLCRSSPACCQRPATASCSPPRQTLPAHMPTLFLTKCKICVCRSRPRRHPYSSTPRPRSRRSTRSTPPLPLRPLRRLQQRPTRRSTAPTRSRSSPRRRSSRCGP